MLTDTGYGGALLIYVLSALLALVLINIWLLRHRNTYLKILLTLPIAAVLLTPAYTEPEGETLAPALVVGAFEWLSAGPEAAEHALRPLFVFCGVSVGVAMVLVAVLFWRRRRNVGATSSQGNA